MHSLHNNSFKKYNKLSSTLTPNGGAGLRGREVMDQLLDWELDNRIINEDKNKPRLYKKLIQGWSKDHNIEIRKLAYTYPCDRNHPWVPTPSASVSASTDLLLFGRDGWCLEELAYPRAADHIDGPLEKKSGDVIADPEVKVESLTAEEVERLATIRAALSARQVKSEVASGGDSEDDESDDDSDLTSSDSEPTSSDSERRDPTYTPSTGSSLTSSTSSLPPMPPASIETQYARLFNAIATAITSFGISAHPSSGQRRFCSVFATLPIPDGGFNRKPDGILIDGTIKATQITWRKVMAILEYTEQEFTLSASVTRQMHTKSYLIMRRQPWRTFVLGISLSKNELRLHYYDHSGTVISYPIDINKSPTKLIDVIATLAHGDRVRLGYDPTIYINEDLLDQQQVANTPPPTARNTLVIDQNPLPGPKQNHPLIIGWVIIPGGKKIDILGIVWTSDGMVGRGTMCYHVRDPETLQEFALKDYWVDALCIHHESEMLDMLKEIPGVPKVIHSWTVGEEDKATGSTERNHSQSTLGVHRGYRPGAVSQQTLLAIGNHRVHRRILMTPFASPIYTFSSLEELVWSFFTISETHQLMTDAGVLHQDVSVNNLMIAPESICPPSVAPSSPLSVSGVESAPVVTVAGDPSIPPRQDHRRGWIVDLDYAKLLDTSTTTSVGTGTLPFLSFRILRIIEQNSRKSNPNDRKAVEQNAEDDMESLFYVLVWICCLYEGPNNSPRRDRSFKETLCYNWAERSFHDDFAFAKLAKSDFINHSGDDDMLDELHPYFKPIFGLLRRWRQMIHEGYTNQTQVSHAEVREILEEAYIQLCDEGTTEIGDASQFRRGKRCRVL